MRGFLYAKNSRVKLSSNALMYCDKPNDNLNSQDASTYIDSNKTLKDIDCKPSPSLLRIFLDM